MNNWINLLRNRNSKSNQSQPTEPEGPLSWTQYQNKLNTAKWREKYREAQNV